MLFLSTRGVQCDLSSLANLGSKAIRGRGGVSTFTRIVYPHRFTVQCDNILFQANYCVFHLGVCHLRYKLQVLHARVRLLQITDLPVHA